MRSAWVLRAVCVCATALIVSVCLDSPVQAADPAEGDAASAPKTPAVEVVKPGGKDTGQLRVASSADNGAPSDPFWVKGRSGLRTTDDPRHLVSLGDYVSMEKH